MANILRELLYDLQAVKEIEQPQNLPYEAGILKGEDIVKARQMLANVYVYTGTVDRESLTEQGTLSDEVDPYWRHSTYYGVWDANDPDRLLMAARLIHPDENGVHSLQIHLEDLPEDYCRELLQANPNEIAELAAYVKAPNLGPVESRLSTLYLIRELIRDSRAKGVKTWVFGLRPQLKTKYERLFGPGLDRHGDIVHLGAFKSEFLPYSVDVERSWRRLMDSSRRRIGSKAIARFVGMSESTGWTKPKSKKITAPRAKVAH